MRGTLQQVDGMISWWRSRRSAKRQRRIEALNTQQFLFAKEATYRRDHGMPVPDYLTPGPLDEYRGQR